MFFVGLGIPMFEGGGGREMARFFVCLVTAVLQGVGFVDRVDDVLSASCLKGLCFFRMRMLRNIILTVALCISVSKRPLILRDGKFFVCQATVVFVRCCRRLDSVIE